MRINTTPTDADFSIAGRLLSTSPFDAAHLVMKASYLLSVFAANVQMSELDIL
jgi:hypothetical protein